MKRGDVIWWVVVDPETGEMCIRFTSRSAARFIADACGAKVAKVVIA
jgi:hypothetical protein